MNDIEIKFNELEKDKIYQIIGFINGHYEIKGTVFSKNNYYFNNFSYNYTFIKNKKLFKIKSNPNCKFYNKLEKIKKSIIKTYNESE